MTQPFDHAEASAALAGLRVLDASSVIAGPFCAMLLADFGCDVVKVEAPVGGDAMRDHGPYANGIPLWWKMLGRNKLSVRCDLRSEAGRAHFLSMVDESDVVILSFRPSTLKKWGLDADALRARNPRLVVARVTGFGDTGPQADDAGFGTMAEAMSGFAHRNGDPDGGPTLPPFGLADSVAGMTLAFGVVVALLARTKSGFGQDVAVSLLEPMLTFLAPQNTVYHANNVTMGRIGNRSGASAPRNLYRCADGKYIAISCSTTSTASRLMVLVGRPEIIEQPWFARAYDRAQHVEELDAVVLDWLKDIDALDAIGELRASGVPVAPVNDAAMLAVDPQIAAINALVSIPDDELGEVCMPNVPIRLSDTPGVIRWTGQQLGAGEAAVAAWGASWRGVAESG